MQDALADMNDTLLGVPGGYNVSYGPTDREYGIEAAMGTDTNSTHWKVFKQVGEGGGCVCGCNSEGGWVGGWVVGWSGMDGWVGQWVSGSVGAAFRACHSMQPAACRQPPAACRRSAHSCRRSAHPPPPPALLPRAAARAAPQTLQDVLTQDGEPVSVAAGLMFGATDSRYWQKYAKQGSLRLFP